MQDRASRFLGASRFPYILGLLVIGMLPSLPATAAITLTSNPVTLATSIEHTPGTITGASFDALPPNGTPHGTATGPLDGFPTDGATFMILTNGDASLADQPNSASDSGADDGGGNVRGPTNWDVSILKIDLDVPPLANCLSIDFRFLTDEYPEWVGSDFNDAFVAELDTSTWTTAGPTVTAPDSFALVDVNSATMSALNAAGTTYDGATALLGASTPITPGAHSLYLSIFDVGDRDIDAAVFLDRLLLSTTAPGDCQAGATVLSVSKTVTPSTIYPGGTVHYTVNVNNPSAGAVVVNDITDILPAGFTYVPGSTTGVTVSDPGISGQTLTWTGPFALPASSSISVQFDAIAPATLGTYDNNASATATGAPVTPSGPTAPVTVAPLASFCGNGALDPGETCDDGNSTNGDGCDDDTANGGNCTPTACGNGVVTAGEVCDDGNLVNGDGCDSNCTVTGCGNGIITGGEQCDDGNTIDGDGCSATCQLEAFCGNGIVDPGETCDPPGTAMLPNGNACRADCTFCGDGIFNGTPGSETCDDGNANNADHCHNNCTLGLLNDPATIRFRRGSQTLDRLKVHGNFDVNSFRVDPATQTVQVSLLKPSGDPNDPLYSVSFTGGTWTRVHTGKVRSYYLFTDNNAKSTGGISLLKIKKDSNWYRVHATVWADLSGLALSSDMIMDISVGTQHYTSSGEWKQTTTGWRLNLIK